MARCLESCPWWGHGAESTDTRLASRLRGLGEDSLATPEHLFAAGYASCFGAARLRHKTKEPRRLKSEDYMCRHDQAA